MIPALGEKSAIAMYPIPPFAKRRQVLISDRAALKHRTENVLWRNPTEYEDLGLNVSGVVWLQFLHNPINDR